MHFHGGNASCGVHSLEPSRHRHCTERFHLIADMDAAGTDKQVVIDHLSDKAKYDFGLITRALDKHDQAAFAELMERYREPIYYMLLKMVNSQDDAEDLMIETFGKAFRRLKQYSPKFAFSTWLFKIASNGAIDFIRKKRIKALSLDKGFTDAKATPWKSKWPMTAWIPARPGKAAARQPHARSGGPAQAALPPLGGIALFRGIQLRRNRAELNLPLGTVKAQLFRGRDILAGVLETTASNSERGPY